MITIGRLAQYAGVTTKTIRVYHAKGLLPEPERDASGYRRYTAQHAIDLIKIRTLAEAGVPLARIRELRADPDTDLRAALHEADLALTARIRDLRRTQQRLRRLAGGDAGLLPPGVGAYLDRLRAYGFSPRWVNLQADLWLLLFTTHPRTAAESLDDQAGILADPALRALFHDYDRAHGLDPGDPYLQDLADRIVRATRDRYGAAGLPGQEPASDIPELIQRAVNASSPAWRRLDTLIRRGLRG
ncbi:MerR family transcriptional regulator [Spirillospora sp. NPDC029432]|uniref:MerR family transcriptional regulator n=1 Tax=Spirillospora sp. NPDC029432 TaxID=3154599 RepID=UPI003453223A